MQKNLLTEIFVFFQHLITQNPTNQDSQRFLIIPDNMKDYWKVIQKDWTPRNYFCLKMIATLAPQ